MPRSGGPSRGCVACRLSKRKCDEQEPTCGRCLTKGLPCSGPPDFFSTHLRNETSKYYKQGETATVASGSSRLIRHAAVGTLPTQETIEISKNPVSTEKQPPGARYSMPPPLSISISLDITDDLRAESFLFHALDAASYVVPYPGWGPFVQYIPKLLADSYNGSALRLTVQALAFCILALTPEYSNYAALASRSYGAALRKTNAAIADLDNTCSDQTLMAILLLSVYECYRPSVGSATRGLYRSHVDGAITLVQHRSLAQFETPLSEKMFRAVRTQMVNLYAHRKDRVPAFPAPQGWKSDHVNDKDALSRLSAAALDLPGLRLDSDYLKLLTDPSDIVEAAKNILVRSREIEVALNTWYRAFLQSFELPLSSAVAGAADTLPWDLVSSYPNLYVASTLNTYRAYCIYLHQARLCCFERLQGLQAPTAAKTDQQGFSDSTASVLALQRMCNDICASVPFHLDNKAVPLGIGEGFVSSALITASFVDILPSAQKASIDDLLHQIAFSERERTVSCLVWDARIMTRMGKFTNIPSALKLDPQLAKK